MANKHRWWLTRDFLSGGPLGTAKHATYRLWPVKPERETYGGYSDWNCSAEPISWWPSEFHAMFNLRLKPGQCVEVRINPSAIKAKS